MTAPIPSAHPSSSGSNPALKALPRRRLVSHRGDAQPPTQMRVMTYEASWVRALWRLGAWALLLVEASLGIIWDTLRGQNTQRRRAARLAGTFARMGGSFVRIGQGLALHAEMTGSPYGEEIAQLRDSAPALAKEHVVAAVEKTTGKPLYETFAQFDLNPIRSTSAACTFQARLRSGERVVVKVLRPGAGERLAADLRLLDWLASAREFVSAGGGEYTREFRRALGDALCDEFDFVREARHQARFRTAARRTGKKFFSAPRVHFDLSGQDVIVQEFVQGIWLWELIAAVEQKRATDVEIVQRLNIDPKKVARQLLWINFWTWHENLFFLAASSPYNVIVGEGGRLFFVDFTSTEAIDHSMKRALHQNMYYAVKQDPLNMARASLMLLEPLPPLDVIELTKVVERTSLQMLFAFQTGSAGRHRPPKTSAVHWRGLLESARRFGVTVDFVVLRLLRSAVTHETLALLIDPEADLLREFRRFQRYRANRAANPLGKDARKRARELFDRRIYLRLEAMAKAGESFVFRLRHVLSLPRVNFSAKIGKASFAVITLATWVTRVVRLAALFIACFVAGHLVAHSGFTRGQLLSELWQSLLFRTGVVVLFLIQLRVLLFRLDDRDA